MIKDIYKKKYDKGHWDKRGMLLYYRNTNRTICEYYWFMW
jgi:hypothetical protein